MIQTKHKEVVATKYKSRWRGQAFPTVGMIDNWYICKIAKDKYVRIHKSEVVKNDERRSVGAGSGA
jgi:hypothetical protein